MPANFWRALRQYGREYTRFSRNARLYLVSFFTGGFAFSGYYLFFNFYLKSLGFDEATIGLLNAVPAVSGVIFALPAGYLGDRVGRKRMLLAGTLVSIAGFVGFCFSPDLLLLSLGLFTFSFGQTVLWTLSAPFMADNSSPQERTQLFSLQFALGTLTHFVGNVGGGFLPRLFGGWLGVAPDHPEALRATLLAAGFCLVLSVVPLVLLTEVRRPAPVQKVTGPSGPASPDKKRRFSIPNAGLIMWLVAPEMLIGLGAGMTIPFLNIYVSGKFGVEFETLGLLFGFAELSTTLAVFIQPVLARRFGKVHSVVLFQALSLPFLVMLGFGPYFWMVAIALYIRGALMQAANPVYSVFIQEQVPEDQRATTSAVLSVTDNLARGSGSAFSGALRGAIGPVAGFNILFGLMIGCYLSSIALFYFKFRHKDHEEAQAQAVPALEPELQEIS